MSGVRASGHRFRDSNKTAFYQLWLLLRSYLLQRFAFDGSTKRPDQDSQERRVAQVSGQGLISVRLPRSLMEGFEANASEAGMDVHETIRQLVLSLRELTDGELASLPEPPREPDNPRLSLYVGWPQMDALSAVSRRTQLSMSRVVRRLIYGLVVTGSIRLDRNGNNQGLDSSRVQRGTEGLDCESIAWVVLALLTIAIVGGVLRYWWVRTRQSKRTLDVSSTERHAEATPQ